MTQLIDRLDNPTKIVALMSGAASSRRVLAFQPPAKLIRPVSLASASHCEVRKVVGSGDRDMAKSSASVSVGGQYVVAVFDGHMMVTEPLKYPRQFTS
jgi:hypothetical protein